MTANTQTPAPEAFSASARPQLTNEETEAKMERLREEHTNNQRPATGDTPEQLAKKLVTLACIEEPRPVHGEIIDQLIEAGADIHYKDKHGCTALLRASAASNAGLVKKLLDLGADPNATEILWHDEGVLGPAICHAACRGSLEVVKLLLAAGADPNAETEPGKRTALTLAIDYARVENEAAHNAIVAALVEGGAKPDNTAYGTWTPLLFAIKCKMPRTAQYLLDHGADPEYAPGGNKPYDAALGQCPEAAKLILNAIGERKLKAREEREEKARLDQWMKDGCPAEGGAKPMQQLKLKPRAL
jgi:hypothetical protein